MSPRLHHPYSHAVLTMCLLAWSRRPEKICNTLKSLARREGFEPTTPKFVVSGCRPAYGRTIVKNVVCRRMNSILKQQFVMQFDTTAYDVVDNDDTPRSVTGA